MVSWTTMNNLATGDVVTEADLDAIRTNLESLFTPNVTVQAETDTFTTTSATLVSLLDGAMSHTTYGGSVLLLFQARLYRTIAGSNANTALIAPVVNGTQWQPGSQAYIVQDGVNDDASQKCFVWYITGLSAGTHTFDIHGAKNTSTSITRMRYELIAVGG